MLYIIGLGLNDEKDLTFNSLEAIKKCKKVYLENYTSNLFFNVQDLENFINKKIFLANRNLVEYTEEIVDEAEDNEVAFLVKGDALSATTHTDLYLRAIKRHVKVKLFHNASIITAVGDTGLSLYKFGKIASIPFNNGNVETPYDVLKENKDMHTLFLLDLNPENDNYMSISEALNYLLKVETKRKEGIISYDTFVVVCCALGSDKEIIKYGKIKDVINFKFDVYPISLIIPGKLHFMEEDMLNLFKI